MIKPVTHDPTVERYLPVIAAAVGPDLPAYRNHIYRVLSYALHFLGDDPRGAEHIAFALVFHDAGLWTDGELAYLAPSEALAESIRTAQAPHLDRQIIADIIHWHHKVMPFRGMNAHIINAARKADWIDASQGWVRSGVRQTYIAAIEAAIPVLDFPNILMRLAKDLMHGNRLAGLWRVITHVYKV